MKKTNNILLLAAIAAAGFAFTSCEDQPDKFENTSGIPSVNYIRSLSGETQNPNKDPEDKHYTFGELVEKASPNEVLCLVGNNLKSVYKAFFNDCEVTLNTSYMEDKTLILTVPEQIPTRVTDKIYLVTKSNDTVKYDFHVIIPAPTMNIDGMTCEYAERGSVATITGKYMIDDPSYPLTVKFTSENGSLIKAEIKKIAEDYTSIDFVIPEEAAEGPIYVSSIYGESKTVFNYMDSRGMLFDFDGKTGLGNHGWHSRTIKSDETSLCGNFLQLGENGATLSEDAGWDDANFSFEYWAGSWETPQNITSGDGIALFNLADFKDSQNKALKFEMYIPSSNPWQAGAMHLCFQPIEQVTISGYAVEGYDNVAAANMYVFNGEGTGGDWAKGNWGRGMYRPWTETGKFDTGDKWITVTIPLTSLIYDRTGAVTNNTPSKETDFASFTMFVMGGGITGTECSPIIKVDNIRVVPIK